MIYHELTMDSFTKGNEKETIITTSGIMLIICAATHLRGVLTRERIPR